MYELAYRCKDQASEGCIHVKLNKALTSLEYCTLVYWLLQGYWQLQCTSDEESKQA